MLRKLWYLIFRILVAAGLAIIVMILPPPSALPAWLDTLWQPVIVFVLICYIGKLLYDTLFFDHYVP
jgi:hypothetical protein